MKLTFVQRNLETKAIEITKDEFIKMFTEDIEAVKEPYRKWYKEKADMRYKLDCDNFQESREKKIQRIIDESYKKYKRESSRQNWVDKEIAKLPTELERGYWHEERELSYIVFDIRPWENGSKYVDVDGEYEHRLGNLYDDAIKNKYFMNCTGWSLVCDDNQSTHRVEIKLHLSEELQAEWDADEKKLYDDIMNFYATCRYCGD
jgi:hypothetical protein